jgi:transcriptional regulator with XRE-family HTH domain
MTVQNVARRHRAQDADRHVGARLRERRIMLGMTQHQLAELVGVTYQQEHKYEKGINRIAAGRLYEMARVLGVEVSHFYEGLEGDRNFAPTTQQRLLLELTRNFVNITNHRHREALAALARALAEPASRDGLAA